MELFDIIDDFIIEEEELANKYFNPTRKQRVVRKRPNHYVQWENEDFKRRFRLQKDTCQYVLSMIRTKIVNKTERNQCVPPLIQLFIALMFYATGSFYITIGDFSGVSTSTACRIVNKVTLAIASLRPKFVRLPRKPEEILQIQNDFYKIARFPRVVAAIDCTHVRITSPGGDTAENFRNRKGYFSINVQAMCTSDLKFINVVDRWPGSTHDSLIFHNSAAKFHFENGSFGNGIILGDNGYFLNQYLLTPFNDPQTTAQRLYNESQIRTRNVIERSFGVWKRRFPVLSIGMRCKLSLAQDIIIATSVLNNLAIERNEEDPPVDPEVYIVSNEFEFVEEIPSASGFEGNHGTRDTLLEYFESF